MRIFVISLPTETTRRSFIRTQFERLGIDFTFFDAIDVRQSRAQYFETIDTDRFLLNAGRTHLTNEISCYASHLMLWRTCITLNEPIIILEDDAGLSDEFAGALPFIESQVATLGFVRLEANCKRSGPRVAQSRTHSAHYCYSYPFSAMGYAISPNAARKFIDNSRRFHAPVDKFIKDFWVHRQPLFQIVPHIVDESEIGINTSSIGTRYKPGRRRLSTRLRRSSYKLSCSLQRFAFNLRYLMNRTRTSARAVGIPGRASMTERIGN